MAKAASKTKKTSAKSKPSAPGRAKAPATSARKPLTGKAAVKPAAKPAPTRGKVTSKPVAKPASSVAKSGKWVFTFGDGKADGSGGMRALRGGRGANLAEMANLGLPVPPGFTIPTSV